MKEVERLRAMISRMDLDELQRESDRINGVLPLEVHEIREYFNKIGTKRIGDFVTHLRRHLYLILNAKNVDDDIIADVLKINRTSMYHYRKMKVNPSIESEVSKNFKYWISVGLYPVFMQSTIGIRERVSTYRLVDDPLVRVRNPKNIIRKDDIILDLN